ncbi:hypothetical protein [Telmatospirillum siberiense]|uniref:Uncharacterized protein n=1 Tax=Telmatospirillum siberiense TaxID=382514 RepID=A0A2N3PNK7_9PROT|nr:hypothetical protein [Telmatospirillum siberiense]PKU21984.1 hypothetical protein CWS72_24070 [Telmatospirillum siberiense]
MEHLSLEAMSILKGTGDHRMSPSCAYVDNEIIGDAFVTRFDVRILRHRHFHDRCPVRDMLPFDERLAKGGFDGASVTLQDGRAGRVLTTASVSFEGEIRPTLCYVLSIPDRGGGDPGILSIPVTEARRHILSISPCPDGGVENTVDLSDRLDSSPKPSH